MFLKIHTGDVNQPITLSINIICKEVSLVGISTSYYDCILRFGGGGEVLDPSLLLLKLFNPLSTNPTKWSNTFKQFVGKLPTNCLSVFDHFVKLALKGLRYIDQQASYARVDLCIINFTSHKTQTKKSIKNVFR